ncbi:hypothetical protein [Candidatus Cardinium hertigii]|uniref:Lipoprotein n=1 Tax=Candidatus Cardinium hertigii TaxID=247481 RepID=A0A2Z3LE20_9BACT|nr:hypothetical protein [Candidatus Cardinium hertigii]AWN82282.1 hypothetical protein DK880_00985 [Candidatus Cardinium hertigii]
MKKKCISVVLVSSLLLSSDCSNQADKGNKPIATKQTVSSNAGKIKYEVSNNHPNKKQQPPSNKIYPTLYNNGQSGSREADATKDPLVYKLQTEKEKLEKALTGITRAIPLPWIVNNTTLNEEERKDNVDKRVAKAKEIEDTIKAIVQTLQSIRSFTKEKRIILYIDMAIEELEGASITNFSANLKEEEEAKLVSTGSNTLRRSAIQDTKNHINQAISHINSSIKEVANKIIKPRK